MITVMRIEAVRCRFNRHLDIYAPAIRLVKIPELQKNMFELAREMEKAGLVEDVVTEGLSLTDVRLCFSVHVLYLLLTLLLVDPPGVR